MNLIIGGQAQGKLDFALDKYSLSKEDVSCEISFDKKIIYKTEDIISALVKNNEDAFAVFEELKNRNPNCIVICNEVGCGLVPIEEIDRKIRDTVGKICCDLAKHSESVYRVFCGVATKLK